MDQIDPFNPCHPYGFAFKTWVKAESVASAVQVETEDSVALDLVSAEPESATVLAAQASVVLATAWAEREWT